jgi:hypothetical protein
MRGCFQEPLSASSMKQLEAFSYPDSSSTDFCLTTAASYQDDDIVAPHPSQRPALPDAAAFQDAPLIITQDPRARSQVSNMFLAQHCRANPAAWPPSCPEQYQFGDWPVNRQWKLQACNTSAQSATRCT